jgi:hypothetical protein
MADQEIGSLAVRCVRAGEVAERPAAAMTSIALATCEAPPPYHPDGSAPRAAGADGMMPSAASETQHSIEVDGGGNSIERRGGSTRPACAIPTACRRAPEGRLIGGIGIVGHARNEMRAAAQSHGEEGQQQFPRTAPTSRGSVASPTASLNSTRGVARVMCSDRPRPAPMSRPIGRTEGRRDPVAARRVVQLGRTMARRSRESRSSG